jgi:hypothetical protein
MAENFVKISENSIENGKKQKRVGSFFDQLQCWC